MSSSVAASARTLFLCAGTQSSGSTLISWCFLQRRDMDGVLDARGDVLPLVPEKLRAPLPWLKFTISSFRFSEVQTHLEADGWNVRPLLVVRDVRAVFNSLIKKDYGRNGTTSDDPPIRLRLMRFLDDWKLFRERGWPMLRYESFAVDPLGVLRETCTKVQLPWDEAMMSWPKGHDQITDSNFGNETFLVSRGSTLTQTLRPALANVDTTNIPAEDLKWLEREFAAFNAAMGYPLQAVAAGAALKPGRAVPRFENTRTYERSQRNQSRTEQAYATAVAHHRAGRSEQAISLCSQIIANKPDHAQALGLSAQIADERGNHEPLAILQRVESLKPGSAEHFHAHGLILAKLGHPDPAVVAIRHAIALQPDKGDLHADLAEVLRQLGRVDEANAVARRAASPRPILTR